jgi:predicted TIM-barrel fold metal-dependent hydrolase
MLELEHRFRVVDVHARLDPEGAEQAATRGRAISPERLEREMHQAGVVRSVVFAKSRPDESYLSANNAVARLSVDRPFVAFARINGPQQPGEGTTSRLRNLASSRKDWHTAPADIEKYAYDDRFHGFKLSPAVDGLPDDEVLDVLDDVGLPVVVHGGVDFPPMALADTLLGREFPVILEHFGAHPLQRDLMESTIDLLGEYEQLHVDTSYVRYRDQLERALMEHPDRVCFGSGAPSAHPNVGVMELLTLDVPEDAMRKAFAKNPARLVDALAPEGEGGR